MSIWVEPLIKMTCFAAGLLTLATYLVALEEVAAACFHDRTWPRWTGWNGLIRPLREGASLLRDRTSRPTDARSALSQAIPALYLAAALLTFATVPFGGALPGGDPSAPVWLTIAPRLDLGPLVFLAMNLLGACCLAAGTTETGPIESAWRRLELQIPLVISLVGIVLLVGSLRLETIVERQAATGWWWLAVQPLGFLVFAASGLVEPLRKPLPLRTALGVYSPENPFATASPSGRVILADSLRTLAVAYLLVLLYGGGWHFWWISPSKPGSAMTVGTALLGFLILHLKVLAVLAGILWLRWLHPHLRLGHWKRAAAPWLLPLSVINVLIVVGLRALTGADAYGMQAAVSWSAVVVTGLFLSGTVRQSRAKEQRRAESPNDGR